MNVLEDLQKVLGGSEEMEGWLRIKVEMLLQMRKV